MLKHPYSILVHPNREPPSDAVMDELRNVLFIIDSILLFTVPVVTWFLTGSTLAPVQKAQKRERQFLTDASHELRTPLSILSAEMEVALQKPQTISIYQHVLRSSKEEVDELISLVENLLFISREQTKHSSPINEKVDITDIVGERIASFQKQAKRKKLTLSINPPKTSLLIHGNPQLLKRLFTNLIDNAIKYTSRGGITVTIKQNREQVVIEIADTGIGISKDRQEKIFDRFYRADTSRSAHGYGLGLSIAKQIIQAHNGIISVKSQEKIGTTMKIVFPLIP